MKHIRGSVFSVFSLLLLLNGLLCYSQKINLKAGNKPLNLVLTDLREEYQFELSFDDRRLSQYYITSDTLFPDPETAIRNLLKGLPLVLSRSGDVLVISPVSDQLTDTKYIVEGQVRDFASKKALPFAYISFRGKWMESDARGKFFCQTHEPPPYDLKISYLGFYIVDTIVNPGSDLIFDLIPADYPIKEVIIADRKILKTVQGGNNAGEISINHHVADFLPGNGDNSVFNLLRLQPGVVAAGELSNDLIIWGSYEGQSRVLFDGFPIFGLKNYNENISAVNPFLVQDIKVFKGGFSPQYGGKAGGIVDITGVEGAKESPDIRFSLNNLTMNGFLSVPLVGKTSFIMAGRITYRDLYEPTSSSLFAARGDNRSLRSKKSNLTVYPDYFFRDINLKVNGEARNGDNWHVNYFTGRDDFEYEAESNALLFSLINNSEEKNIQDAGSASYTKRWGGGNVTIVTATFSEFYNERFEFIEVTNRLKDTVRRFDEHTITSISESEIRIDHVLSTSENNTMEFGLSFTPDRVNFSEDTSDYALPGSLSKTTISGCYFSDKIHIGDRAVFKPGLRMDYSSGIRQLFIQPRVSFTFNITERLRLKSSAGRYNQFLVLNSVIDGLGNLRYKWTISDTEKIPVVTSDHYIVGMSWSDGGFEISAEGYLKSTDGLTRFLKNRNGRMAFNGSARTKGLDLFIRKDIRSSTIWASYSLGRTEEHFQYFPEGEYRRAPHDQLHEFKIAGILDLEPFHISANFVHGSGLKPPVSSLNVIQAEKPYDRFDISAVYRFKKDDYFFDAGLSLLNLFNTENIRYSNYTLIPVTGSDPFSIHAEAVPRMLTVFINFSFGD